MVNIKESYESDNNIDQVHASSSSRSRAMAPQETPPFHSHACESHVQQLPLEAPPTFGGRISNARFITLPTAFGGRKLQGPADTTLSEPKERKEGMERGIKCGQPWYSLIDAMSKHPNRRRGGGEEDKT